MSSNARSTQAAALAASAQPAALPTEVIARVDALTKIQEERDELEKKHDAELRDLEIKYNALYESTYEKRKEIVTGAKEAEGVASGAPTKGIPKFWLTAMQNHSEISSFIEEADVPALEYLEDVKISFLDKLQGFALHFTFRSNPYFENATLTKEYLLPGEMLGAIDEDDEVAEGENAEEDESPLEGVKKITGTEIIWKAGKNMTVKMVSKKIKGSRGKPKKTVQREEEVPSFFRFFDTPDMKLDEDMEAEEAMEIVNQIQADISVAQALRDDLLPEAVRWFTGEAANDEDEDGEDGEDEDEEEEEEEEAPPQRRGRGNRGGRGPKPPKIEEDEEGDEDDEEIRKTLQESFAKKVNLGDKGPGKGPGGPGAAGGADQQECKQQ